VHFPKKGVYGHAVDGKLKMNILPTGKLGAPEPTSATLTIEISCREIDRPTL
jgi:hypothetical protein